MSDAGQGQELDFSVDKDGLFREENFTDLKAASIRKLIPIKADGTDDPERDTLFVGHTQLMSPQGPLPIHAPLDAGTLDEAIQVFPDTMKHALAEVVERVKAIQEQQQREQAGGESRIVVPGR